MERSRTEEESSERCNGGEYQHGETFKRGESFKKGRYILQSGLGHGTFSTVWVAWDTQLNKYVALKITKSNASFGETAYNEINMLKKVGLCDPHDKQCVVKLLDHFTHKGRHVCLVLELLGDNLGTLLEYNNGRGIPLHMVKEICCHVLRGLEYLHGELSIIHTDLKPENILLLSTIDPENDPKKSAAPVLKEVPAKPKTWGNWESLFDALEGKALKRSRKPLKTPAEKQKLVGSVNPSCKIADLGNACMTTNQLSSHIQTIYYKCPETLIQSSYCTHADLWSVGCIAYELATGEVLFDPQSQTKQDRIVNHLGLMMDLLGVMPKEIALGGKLSKKFFDQNGKLKGYRIKKRRALIDLFQEDYSFSSKDAYEFSDFLASLLDFVPRNRPTARQALDHPWFLGVPRLLKPSFCSSSSAQTRKLCKSIPESDTAV